MGTLTADWVGPIISAHRAPSGLMGPGVGTNLLLLYTITTIYYNYYILLLLLLHTPTTVYSYYYILLLHTIRYTLRLLN